ncbi:hypothetical protein Tco_0664378 [Tanacetum coccineum]
MRMEQYLTHTDYALWEVIMNGDAPAAIASASAGIEGPIPPKTAEQKLARKNELKAKSTRLLAIPSEPPIEDFHGIKMQRPYGKLSKSKARFGGNKESKKMKKTILKQQYENFAASRSEGLDKTYDRMDYTKYYEVYRIFEIKGQSSSSSNSQNVAFVSSKSTSSTNEVVNTAYDVTIANSQGQAYSSTYADDVMFSFFANRSNSPQLDNEDLEQIDTDDLKEMDLKWKVAMLAIRVKRFLKKTGMNLNFNGKETNAGHRNGDAPRRNAPVDTSTTNALVVQDGIGGYDWSFQAKEGITNFALMAYTSQGSSSSSSSDSELEEALKEKDDLKLKLEKFEESSKNLTKLINSKISAKDKAGLGYDSQMNKSEVVHSVFNKLNHNSSKSSKDSLEQPKDVRPSAPIIEEWESDSDDSDDSVFRPKLDQTKPKFTKINFVKSDENTRKSVIEQLTYRQAKNLRKSQSPRLDKRNWNGIITQKLGNGFKFNKKACFVCGSLNHLIKDYNFYENKMAGKLVLNNMRRVTDQREVRAVWKNSQRVNHQNCKTP